MDIFQNHPDVRRQLRAMWVLYATGMTERSWLLEQTRHASEHVRAWAVRFLSDMPGANSPGVAERFRRRGVGRTVLAGVQATQRACGRNTNLGTLLLLAPLAAVDPEVPLAAGIGPGATPFGLGNTAVGVR